MEPSLAQLRHMLKLVEDSGIWREHLQKLFDSGFFSDLLIANVDEVEREELRKVLGLKPLDTPLLEEIGTAIIPATTAPFAASEQFIVGNAQAKISWIGSNFQEWFLGKTEEPLAESILCYARLVKSSVDGPILTELGDKAETTLAQIFALMERQPNGEKGVLLTNGWVNVFYVRDFNAELRAVCVYWSGGGWSVSADSVANPYGWRDGVRVFSRNS